MTILTENQMPKLRPLPMPDGAPHREWLVLEDWHFNCVPLNIIFFIPKGFIFNGASVPRFFSNIFPATGYLFIAALIHDYLYEYAFYIKVIEFERIIVQINKADSDDFFEEIADWLYKDHWFKTNLAKAALVAGGQGAWDACRKADGTYVKPPIYKYWGNADDDDFDLFT